MGYASQLKGSHVSLEMVRMTLLRLIIKGKGKALGEKSPLGGLNGDQKGCCHS